MTNDHIDETDFVLLGRGFEFKGYKSFRANPCIIDPIKKINIITGKNNSGKSSIVDILNYHMKFNKKKGRSSKELVAEYYANRMAISEYNYKKIGLERIQVQTRIGTDSIEMKRLVENEYLVKSIPGGISAEIVGLEKRIDHNGSQLFSELDAALHIRISSERDVKPEYHSFLHLDEEMKSKYDKSLSNYENDTQIDEDGLGFTSVLSKIVNNDKKAYWLIDEVLRNHVNEVYMGETEFVSIRPRKLDNDKVSIFLAEELRKPFMLSECGSGLKTVLLALGKLIIACYDHETGEIKPDHGVASFTIEEPENNLHPDLQRSLMAKLVDMCNELRVVFFVTTHSPVIINYLSSFEDSQIVHVQRDKNGESSAFLVQSSSDQKDTLLGLGCRMSDLLLSENVLWVDGPSDRLYVIHWLSVISDGKLVEGVHYTCVMTGGNSIYHFTSGESPIPYESLNHRHHYFGDLESEDKDEIKKPMQKKFAKSIREKGGVIWFTDGKEVECYITPEIISKEVEDYSDKKYKAYSNTYNKVVNKLIKKPKSKVDLAEIMAPHFTIEQIKKDEGLLSHLVALASAIMDNCKMDKKSILATVKIDHVALERYCEKYEVRIAQLLSEKDPSNSPQ